MPKLIKFLFLKDNLENDSRDERQQHQIPGMPRNPDHNEIQSALTYTTQFINLIAFYLNIVLPYNLPHKYIFMSFC